MHFTTKRFMLTCRTLLEHSSTTALLHVMISRYAAVSSRIAYRCAKYRNGLVVTSDVRSARQHRLHQHYRQLSASASTKVASKDADTANGNTSAPASDASPSYWRAERVVYELADRHRSKTVPSKPTSRRSYLLRTAAAAVKKVNAAAIGTIDVFFHPTRLPPLLANGWKHAKEGASHYWNGTKLLAADTRTALSLMMKTTSGNTLSRRERKQLERTVSDLFRLVPFAMFVIIPFAEFLLPIALRLFPNLLPSTFQPENKRDEQLKRELKARLNYAEFLQSTLASMAKQQAGKGGKKSRAAESLLDVIKQVQRGERVSNDELLRLTELFDDQITLDNLNRSQLEHVCQYMGIPTFGSDQMLRWQLQRKINRIRTDDKLIASEGIDSMNSDELRSACHARGMRGIGLTRDGYRRNLSQWIDLSLNKKVPETLLIMSRALSISEQPSTEDIRAALTSMSDDAIGEVALDVGLTDPKQRLEFLKRQNELIKADDDKKKAKEAEKKAKAAEKARKVKADSQAKDAAASDTTDITSSTVDKEASDVDDDEMKRLVDLAQNLVAMTSVSAVDEERKRLQTLMNKVSNSSKMEAKVIDALNLQQNEAKQESSALKTLEDVAKWRIAQINAIDTDTTADTKQETETSSNAATTDHSSAAPKDKSVGESAEDDSAAAEERRERLSAQLSKMMEKLRKRIADVDEKIGHKLPQLAADHNRGLRDEALLNAITKLSGTTVHDAAALVSRMKALASERSEGRQVYELTVDDLTAIAKEMENEKGDSEQNEQTPSESISNKTSEKQVAAVKSNTVTSS